MALFWAPANQPAVAGAVDFSNVQVTITANQAATATQAATTTTTTIAVVPPPVVLVHGIWSNGNDWAPFATWLGLQGYQSEMINIADYGIYNYLSFASPQVQGVLTAKIRDAIVSAASLGVVARKVDVVAHSMGGLATRYLMENGPPSTYPSNWIPSSPVHNLITVATPFDGSQLATELWNNVDTPLIKDPVLNAWCANLSLSVCTLGEVFKSQGKQIDTGVLSLEPGVEANYFKQPIPAHSGIVGLAPTLLGGPSCTERVLDWLVGAFVPGQTVASTLGSANDTIVTTSSQGDGATNVVTVNGVVHAPLCPVIDVAETQDSALWSQIFNSLQGGTLSGEVPAVVFRSAETIAPRADTPADTPVSAPPPVFDLSGYTQVPITNAVISPANNSSIALGSSLSITATSTTKTIAEILVMQSPQSISNSGVLYATQAPFTASFTPSNLGTFQLTLFVIFTDNTYATQALSYTVQTTDSVVDIRIPNPPIASLSPNQ